MEWIATQSWCTGAVGTWGASALGIVQMKSAAEQPDHLLACAPIVRHYRETYELSYPGGVYKRNRNDFVAGTFGSDIIREHPYLDGYWVLAESLSGEPTLIDVPMLHISDWYDHETIHTKRDMEAVQESGGQGAAGRQQLLIGPWSHGHVGDAGQGELAYPAAESVSSQRALEFFDHYLRGAENSCPERPAVDYFVVNDDVWCQSDFWPPAGASISSLYLTEDGGLSNAAPESGESWRTLASDPEDPVPTLFGAVLTEGYGVQGPGDISSLKTRPDVAAFFTPPVEKPLTILGSAKATIWMKCDAVDADIAARLVQACPDRRDVLLADGIARASLRNGFQSPEWLSPDTPYRVTVELAPLAATIPPGHALGLYVAPANFDLFDKNMHDGSCLSDDPEAVATQALLGISTGASFPSTLEIPVGIGDCPGEEIFVCGAACDGVYPLYETPGIGIRRACDGAVVKIAAGTYEEDIVLDQPKTVVVVGGWNAGFSNREGTSEIAGSLLLQAGCVWIDGLAIR